MSQYLSYPEVSSLVDSDLILVSRNGAGTKRITRANLALDLSRKLGATYILNRSFNPVVAPADTNENQVLTFDVPAGVMGVRGILNLQLVVTMTNNGNSKFIRVKFGGTLFVGAASVPNQGLAIISVQLANVSLTSQTGFGVAHSAVAFYNFGGGTGTGSKDTSLVQPVSVTFEKATAGDTMTLLSSVAHLTPG